MPKQLQIIIATTLILIVGAAIITKLNPRPISLKSPNPNLVQNTNNQVKEPMTDSLQNPTARPSQKAGPPAMQIDQSKKYSAVLETSAGTIVISLNAAQTPITVNNFVSLAREGFYDNTIFHRTIKDFMIQGGDPQGNGTGGPGYRFNDEPFQGEYTRGTVAMANAGPNTNGSQFFIMHADYALPKNYVIFGKVEKGLETVDTIANAPVVRGASGELSKPAQAVTVKSVTIVEE
ncbi:MAG: peptidylprolyl isomerase [Patescibacteria group bacterium]